MYMDVKKGSTWRRALAVVLSVCMILGLVQIPTITVQAEESNGKAYHSYQNNREGEAATVTGSRTAVLFTVNQNESQGQEQVENVSFDLQAIEDADTANAKATVSLYANPNTAEPDSGEFVCSTEVYNLTAGTNTVALDAGARVLSAGETFAAIVSLEGDAYAFGATKGAEEGTNYVAEEDGSWADLSEQNLSVNICVRTTDVEDKLAVQSVDADEVSLQAASGSTPELDRASIEIPVGTTTTLKINNADTKQTYTWKSSDTDCATVDSTGAEVTVTAKKVGSCEVTVSDGESFERTCTVKVTKNIANATASFADTDAIVYDGTAKVPEVVVKDGDTVLELGVDYTLVYSDGVHDTSAINAGKATVTINGQGNYGGNQSLTFQIAEKSFSSDNIEIAVATLEYNETTPNELGASNPVVKDTTLQTTLSLYDDSTGEGDYKIVFAEDEAKRYTEGSHRATLQGMGNYAGTISFTYIVQVDMTSNDNVEVALGADSYVYTGKEIQPAFVVSYKGQALTKDVDYTVEYKDNLKVGTATITITGIENSSAYKGTVKKEFEIVKKNISNSDHTSSTVMVNPDPLPIAARNSTNEVIPDFTLVYNGTTLVKDTDYTVTAAITDGTDWSDAKNATLTITGIGDNFEGSRTLSYQIGDDIKDILGSINAIANVTYDGNEQTPTITFSKSNDLEEGKDYSVSYENNINAGTATVTVRGINGYGGTLTASFTIVPIRFSDLEDSCFSYQSSQVYNPSTEGVRPDVTVTVGGHVLEKNIDYILSWEHNNQIATASAPAAPTITVTAKSGNFTGTKELKFNINRCPVTNANISITGINKTYTYTGEEIQPAPVVTYTYNGTEYILRENIDYTLEYNNNVEASNSASVTITGIGHYTGYKKITFSIVKIPVESLKIVYNKTTNDVNDYDGVYLTMKTYEDDEITLEDNIALYLDDAAYQAGTPLVRGTDYTLSYENNDKVSTLGKTASVTITGMGNYAGSVTLYFLIARDIATLSIDDIEQQTYTGEEIEISNLSVNKSWFKELTQGEDYTVAYENNVEVAYDSNDDVIANAKVIVTGSATPTTNGCYYGTTSKSFKIVPRDLSDDDVAFEVEDQSYKGTAVTLDVDKDITGTYTMPSSTVKELEAGTDFKISTNKYNQELYSDNEGVGTATVLLEGKGNFKGTREVNFEIVGKSVADDTITAMLDQDTYTYSGNANTPTVTLVDDGYTLILNTDYTVSYSNNVNAGTATVTVKGKGNYSGTREIPFTIEAVDISGTDYTMASISDKTYTGAAITPKPAITYKKGGNTYTLDASNYIVTYVDNENVGTATVTVTGTGNYSGEKTETFHIVEKDISADDVKIADIPAQAYTGVKVCPDLTITYGDYTLVSGKDYTTEYTDNVLNGVAKVTVTGIGNFKETKETTFHISTSIIDSDFAITCEGAGKTYTYTGAEITPSVTVTRTSLATTLIKGKDYEVTYKDNINAGTATVSVTGTNNYAGTKTFTFKIAKKDISADDVTATLAKTSYEYTGSQITPAVSSVVYGSYTLKTGAAGNDYKVVYGANIAVGTNAGYVTIDASDSSNFTGTKTLHFDIVAKSIGAGSSFATGFTMDAIPTQGYTGKAVTPTPAVRYKKSVSETVALTLGTDYKVRYADNIEIGTASIIITGIGNYQGTVTQTFAIKGSIEGAVVSGIESSYDYTGSAITPVPTQVALDGEILTKDVDYSLTYQNNTNLGEATLKITGIGNYGGSISKTFQIIGDIKDATVSTITNQPFTGNAITPSVVVTWNGKILVKDTDYTVSYKDNVNVGFATVIITGKGNFKTTSQIETTFEIVPTDGYFVISDITDQYYCGSTITPEFTVTYNGKTLTEGDDYTVFWANNTNAGTATLTITGEGSYSQIATATKDFDILPLDVADLTLTDVTPAVGYTIAPREYTGNAITPAFTLAYMEGETTVYKLRAADYSVTYSDNTEVGIATMVIKGSGTNCKGSRTETFQITQKDIAGTTISQISNQTYTGKELTPSLTIKNGIRVLTAGTDYEVSYTDNVEVGTATAHIVGMGNYSGTKDVVFAISPLSLAAASVSVSGIESQAYTGSEITPDVTVTYTDSDGEVQTLVKDTDYTVSYSNNVKAGSTAKVIITGTGNFTGTKTLSFAITTHDVNADDVTVDAIPNQAYTGSAITPELTLTCGDYTLVKGTDYTVVYSDNEEIGTASATVTGKGNFTGERVVSFRIVSGIENAEIASGLEKSYSYTGSAITPSELVVQIGATVLKEGTDYTLSYENNTKVGTAQVTLNGAGNYGGTKTFEFSIVQKSIKDSDIVLSGFADEMEYTGAAVTQDVTLTYGKQTLKQDTDYTVTYTNNLAVGNVAQMTITALGNYSGTITKTFKIVKKAIFEDDVVITNVSTSYTYTGSKIAPTPVVTLDGKTLKSGTDYTVAYASNVNAGVATMTITGKGNYSGTKKVAYNILRKSIARCTFSSVANQTYTGKDIKPNVTVKDGSKSLKKGTDYTLTYQNNRKAGVASVVVTGKGNYNGSKTIRFNIKPGNVTSLAKTSVSKSSIGLSWKEKGAVTGYEIYRKTGSGSYKRVAKTKNKSYTNKKLKAGTKYSYKVRAYLVTNGETYYGSFSDVVKVTTKKK